MTEINLRAGWSRLYHGLMSENVSQPKEPTLYELAAELARLRDRIEDLEDARELDAAIQRNNGKPLIPWEQVKTEIGL